MPRYSVAVPVFATTWFECDADSKEEAIKKAQEHCDHPSVCHQCSKEVQIDAINDEGITIECVEEIE